MKLIKSLTNSLKKISLLKVAIILLALLMICSLMNIRLMPQTIEGFETNSPEMKAFLQKYIIILRDKLLEYCRNTGGGSQTEARDRGSRYFSNLIALEGGRGDTDHEQAEEYAIQNPIELLLYEIWNYENDGWINLCGATFGAAGQGITAESVIGEYLVAIFTTPRRNGQVNSGGYIEYLHSAVVTAGFNRDNIENLTMDDINRLEFTSTNIYSSLGVLIEQIIFKDDTTVNSFRYWFDGDIGGRRGAGNRNTYERIRGYEDFNLTDNYLPPGGTTTTGSESIAGRVTQLLGSYGQTGDNAFDLNNDDVVNVKDLLILLNNGGR